MNSTFAKFFPEKVYRCDCLAKAIASCLANEACSLKDIYEKKYIVLNVVKTNNMLF